MSAKLDNLRTKSIGAPNPSSFGNAIATKVFNRSAEANVSIERMAEVIDSSERANTCKLIYTNEEGIKTITDNVIVPLSESFKNSFPKPGSRVIIKLLNKIPVVVREYIDDIDQFYAKRKIVTDNSPNGDASVSYMILPGGGLD